jgi:hypothetical protein
MSPPPDTTRFTPKPGVISTDLENELVLLDPETQEMYRLNETGRVIWLNLETHDLGGLVQQLVHSFDVPPAQAGQDVRAVLAELESAGLIARR